MTNQQIKLKRRERRRRLWEFIEMEAHVFLVLRAQDEIKGTNSALHRMRELSRKITNHFGLRMARRAVSRVIYISKTITRSKVSISGMKVPDEILSRIPELVK